MKKKKKRIIFATKSLVWPEFWIDDEKTLTLFFLINYYEENGPFFDFENENKKEIFFLILKTKVVSGRFICRNDFEKFENENIYYLIQCFFIIQLKSSIDEKNNVNFHCYNDNLCNRISIDFLQLHISFKGHCFFDNFCTFVFFEFLYIGPIWFSYWHFVCWWLSFYIFIKLKFCEKEFMQDLHDFAGFCEKNWKIKEKNVDEKKPANPTDNPADDPAADSAAAAAVGAATGAAGGKTKNPAGKETP